MSGRQAAALRRLDAASNGLGVLAFVTLLLHFGFPGLPIPGSVELAWTATLSSALFLESLWRLLVVADPWRYLARNPLRYLVLVIIALELSGVATWSEGLDAPGPSALIAQVYLCISLLAHLGSWLKAAILANRWLANLRIPVLAISPLSFASVIVAGTLILWMPGMRREELGLLDAAFTATSAVCVTGLATIDSSAAFSPVGQAVLAILIQVGGIGTLTVMGLLALWSNRRLSIGERAAFSELLGGAQLADSRRIVGATVKATLAIEAAGSVMLWAAFRGKVAHPLLYGIFHAVSAFCNAGFSLFPDSFSRFADDPAVLGAVMALVFAGSLGFPAISGLWRSGTTRLIPWIKSEPLDREARFALRSSLFLVAAGALAFLMDSWLAGGDRNLLRATFESVTLRTAGFQAESQRGFGVLGASVCLAFMAVGASSQSTGGGMKTSLAARLFMRLDDQERGERGRPLVALRSFKLALALAGSYLALALAAGLGLAALEGIAVGDALFESFSALGTVGLSRDLTPSLTAPSKALVMILMFTGRVLFPLLAARAARRLRPNSGDLSWA